MVKFYLLTFPRFPLRKKDRKSYLGKNRTHDFRTSRCAAYLLDHLGDELHTTYYILHTSKVVFIGVGMAHFPCSADRVQDWLYVCVSIHGDT